MMDFRQQRQCEDSQQHKQPSSSERNWIKSAPEKSAIWFAFISLVSIIRAASGADWPLQHSALNDP